MLWIELQAHLKQKEQASQEPLVSNMTLSWHQREAMMVSFTLHLGAATGWVSPLPAEDKEFIKYFRSVFKRYNINPSKATRLEYDFVTRVAESEFYLQQANA